MVRGIDARTLIGRRAALALPPAALVAVAAAGRPAMGQQRIQPEPVFPDLPEPVPPAEFLALRLHLTVRPAPPRYQPTRITVGDFVAVLPADGRKWRKYTVGNSWTLRLVALRIGASALDDVWFSFTEDDLAAPSGAASCRAICAGGQRLDQEQSLVLTRAVLSLVRKQPLTDAVSTRRGACGVSGLDRRIAVRRMGPAVRLGRVKTLEHGLGGERA